MKQILQYLKRQHVADTHTINRLFVSAFIKDNHIRADNYFVLHKYLIEEREDVAKHLEWILKHLRDRSIKLGVEELIGLFEFVISPADRIVTGAVYTPERVRHNILSHCLGGIDDERLWNIRLADISCGCGGFLMNAAQTIHHRTGKSYVEIYRENIFGVDIADYAIE